MHGNKDIYSTKNYTVSTAANDTIPDTFELIANYRDPFRRTVTTQPKRENPEPKTVIPTRVRQRNVRNQ